MYVCDFCGLCRANHNRAKSLRQVLGGEAGLAADAVTCGGGTGRPRTSITGVDSWLRFGLTQWRLVEVLGAGGGEIAFLVPSCAFRSFRFGKELALQI